MKSPHFFPGTLTSGQSGGGGEGAGTQSWDPLQWVEYLCIGEER